MNLKQIKTAFLWVGLLCASVVCGQTVTGVVSDGSLPLAGASIIVKGTTNGVVSDFDGLYTINNVADDAVLVFSYIGFASQEIPVNGRSQINVSLSEDTNLLDEVVVVGYGTQKKSTLTTSIASVDGNDIREIPAADIAQTLQGRAAGVVVTNTGSPGGRTAIRIRGLGTFGDGDPLYVVDGVFTNSINSINPSSIAKVDVLKDAAATAIYGSRGSNGVIIITTDRGTTGKTSFKFNTYTGFQQSNQRYDLLNTEQYIQYIREISAQSDGGGLVVGRIANDPSFDGNGIDTDWQDELFRSASITNYDFNASGGSDKGRFSFGLSAFDQDGIYIDTNFQRYTFNITSEAEIFENFKVGETMALGFTETIAPQINGGREPLYNIIASSPYLPVRDENGVFTSPDSQDVNNSRNQVLVQETDDNFNRNTSIIGSLYAEFQLFKGLTFRSQYGIDLFYDFQDNISRAFQTTGQFNQEFTSIFKQRRNRVSKIFTNTLNYNTSLGKHNFNLTLVSERQDTKDEISRGSLQTTLSSQIPELNNGIASSFTVTDNLISYLGRLNYDFDNKYLIQASIRRDKSSIFAPGRQVGWFPAASVGWVASNESFLEDSFINNLKLRASYGVTGNNRVARNSSVNVFEGTLSPRFNYVIDGELTPGVSINGGNNFDLTWEESIKQNYGFDLGLWDNKFTFSAEYFINGSDGLIVGEPQAPSAGVPGDPITGVSLFRNVGDVEVKGVELTFGYNDYEGDFKWSLWANISNSESEVTSLGKVDQILQGGFNPPFSEQLTRIAPNEPLFHFFGFEFDGVYADEQAIIDDIGADNLDPDSGQAYIVQPGDVRYRDINGDGDITDEDRVVIGDPNPDFTYAANLSANYKGWDASALITGVQGVDALNANTWFLQGQENVVNHGTEVLRRWQNPGDITDVPRFRFEGNNPNNRISTRYIEDASYARLRNVTIGYSLSENTLNDVFKGILSKVRLYVQTQNLVTLTKYSGLDPEIEPFYNATGLIVGLNVDRGRAPQPTTFLAGLQVEF
ncbi:MAG: TonB-dependent receptor [Saonia sp.]